MAQPVFGKHFFRQDGAVKGPGTGTSDSIPAILLDQKGTPVSPAALSDGEFVITKRVVDIVGGGNNDRGQKILKEWMSALEQMGKRDQAQGQMKPHNTVSLTNMLEDMTNVRH